MPLTGNSWPAEIEVPGRAASTSAIVDRISLPVRSVTEDYFAVMGIRLVEGRLFLPSDNGDAPPVGIVNQAFVRRYLGTSPPIGQQLRFPGNDKPTTIVGVIADTRTEQLREAPEPELYAASGRTARSRSTSSCAPPAIRWRWPRRSPPRCAACRRRQPWST